MAAKEQITVKVVIDDQLSDPMKKAANTAETQSKKIKKSFGGAEKAIKGVGAAFVGLFAAKKVIGFLDQSVKLADIQVKSQALLTNALGKSTKALQAQASALQRLTLFGDEETIAAQARLAAFTKEEKAIMRLTPLVQDFATAKGMDLAGAAELIGKSFGSSTNALSRYGIQIDGAAGSTERLNQLTERLEQAVGGASEAVAGSGAGAIKQMQNAIGDLQEAIGQALLPSLNAAARGVTALTEKVTEFFQTIAKNQQESTIKRLESDIASFNEQLEKGFRNRMVVTGPGAGVMVRDKLTNEDKEAIRANILEAEKEIQKIRDEIAGKGITPGGGGGGGGDDIGGITKGDARPAGLPGGFTLTEQDERDRIERAFATYDHQRSVELEIVADTERQKAEIRRQAQDAEDEERAKNQEKMDAEAQRELERRQKVEAIKLESVRGTFSGISQLLRIAGRENKKAAQAAKAVAIGEAIINTSVAATKAFKTGWDAGVTPYDKAALAAAFMASAIITGTAQVATIASQNFARGGIVGGNSFTGDNVQANVNSGEMILNREQQGRLFRAIDEGGLGGSNISVGGDTIIINGNADEGVIDAIAATREKQLEDLRDMLFELQSAGQI